MLSVGVLYRTQDFLDLVYHNPISITDFYNSFKNFYHIQSKYIIDTALDCKWIKINSNDMIILCDNGRFIYEEPNSKYKLRLQIKDLLLIKYPDLLQLAMRGRSAIRCFTNQDTIQCFRDAGLLDEIDDNTVSWWDNLISYSYTIQDTNRLKIGRKGEKLSINYEELRLGQKPIWASLYDTTLGYDIVSKTDNIENNTLIIEVKTSEKPLNIANFYLTRNEWDVLSTHKHAILHLWSLDTNPPKLCILPIDALSPHIPDNNNLGEWQQVKIPFDIMKHKIVK